MLALLLYDIASDRKRTKAADICLDYGLERIQYSAFLGDISATRREELVAKLRRLLLGADARIHVFALCEKDARLMKALTFGQVDGALPFGKPTVMAS